jgi:hypothetical protein
MKYALTLAGLTLLAISATAQDAKAQIEKSNKALTNAMMKKDFAAMEKILRATCTKDFQYIEEGAKGKPMNLDGMIAGIKGGLSGFEKVTQVSSVIVSTKVTGKTAIVKAKHLMGGTMTGPDKKKHTMTMSGVAVETYVNQGGVWKMSKMVWGDSKMMMDGKAMPMPTGQ